MSLTTHKARKSNALELLGVTKEAVERQPQISHLYKRIGGIKTVLQYLRGSDDPDARMFLSYVDRLGSDHIKRGINLETFCAASGIPTSKLAGIITTAMIDQNAQEAVNIAAHFQPEMVKTSIKYAKTPEGEGDRKMLHQHSGFLPVPKNQVTNIFGGARIDARDQSQKVILSSTEDAVKRMSDRFNERMLGAPAQPLLPPGDSDILDAEE